MQVDGRQARQHMITYSRNTRREICVCATDTPQAFSEHITMFRASLPTSFHYRMPLTIIHVWGEIKRKYSTFFEIHIDCNIVVMFQHNNQITYGDSDPKLFTYRMRTRASNSVRFKKNNLESRNCSTIKFPRFVRNANRLILFAYIQFLSLKHLQTEIAVSWSGCPP